MKEQQILEVKMKILKTIRLVIKYIVMYLSMLMPRSKKIWVFGAWLGEKYADNTKALFEQAQKRKDIHAVWITKNPSVVEEIRKLGYEAYTFTSGKGIWYQLRAGYAFETNGISDFKHAFLGRAVFINLWHGVPLKKVGYDDKYAHNWDSPYRKLRDKIVNVPLGKEYVVATSETIATIYESAFRRPRKNILCLGQPRNDIFFEARDKQLFPDKKIILYAPTHRKEGKEKMELSKRLDFERIQTLCEKWDFYFVIKKHFYHKEEKEAIEKYSRILDVSNQVYDTQELLLETDILITDYSSIYIDFMLLNRPILFYAYDYEQYLQEDRQMYFIYDEVTPGPIVKDGGQLVDALEQSLSGKQFDAQKQKEILELFYCEQGRTPVSNTLLDLVQSGKLR